MVKGVDLLSYWMPVIRQIREFKEIAKAEDPEILALLEACNSALNNFFISTANEQGISRFEKMLGIYPEDGVDLETRRLSVLTAWASKEEYTDEWLYNKLSSMCGGEVIIDHHHEDYSMDISVECGVKGVVDILLSLLSDVIPCNLMYKLETYTRAQKSSTLFAGVAVSTAMSYQITNDITGKVSAGSTIHNAVASSTATVITVSSEMIVLSSTALLGRAVAGSAVVGTT